MTTSPVVLPNSNVFIVGVTLGPSGTSFSSPTTITFPLGTQKTAGTKLLVLLYDPNANPTTSSAGVATVDAGGMTASMTVNHFSTLLLTGSYVVGGTATNGPGMGFIFSTGVEFDGAPVDFAFIASGPGIRPNHSPAKTTTDAYASITRATDGGYAQTEIPIQLGTVILFKGQMPGDTNYYKMIVTDITTSTVSFVYAAIAAPLTPIGSWDIGGGNTMSIMASAVAGVGYIADVHDGGGNLVSLAAGNLAGGVLAGMQSDPTGAPTVAFSITFDPTFTHFTGTWSGTKI